MTKVSDEFAGFTQILRYRLKFETEIFSSSGIDFFFENHLTALVVAFNHVVLVLETLFAGMN